MDNYQVVLLVVIMQVDQDSHKQVAVINNHQS